MGKNKLARWNELDSFDNVIQPEIGEVAGKDHPIKGKWNKELFKNSNPVVLELGCGKGEYTVGLATRFPGKNYIGVDIKGARMWRGAKTSNENKLGNVAFLRTRIEFITSFFTTDEVDEIWVTFPDPHPGGKNSNKRLISPWFLNLYRQFLKDKGIVHLKTDNKELYAYTKSVVEYNEQEILFSTNDLYSEELPDDILSIRTHYENIFLKAGLKINYITFRLDKEKTFRDGTGKTKNG
ncbi:MAG: tRNA (guanosine(46)-N7)-methyltransferase TrmB [Bacteroidales bacterium]|nr:tRNA (guanosine(46)-N7)-methyltransferase TrmB [Bacteroidales bacterium]